MGIKCSEAYDFPMKWASASTSPFSLRDLGQTLPDLGGFQWCSLYVFSKLSLK